AAGRVELGAVQQVVVAVAQERRLLFAQCGIARLRHGIADDVTAPQPPEPELPLLAVRSGEFLLHDSDVAAKDVGNIRVGLRKVNEEREELPGACPIATEPSQDTQGAEAPLTKGRDGVERQLALAVAPHRALCDLCKDGGEDALELGVARRFGQRLLPRMRRGPVLLGDGHACSLPVVVLYVVELCVAGARNCGIAAMSCVV